MLHRAAFCSELRRMIVEGAGWEDLKFCGGFDFVVAEPAKTQCVFSSNTEPTTSMQHPPSARFVFVTRHGANVCSMRIVFVVTPRFIGLREAILSLKQRLDILRRYLTDVKSGT